MLQEINPIATTRNRIFPRESNVTINVLRLLQKMDGNKDGVVTLSEFLEACQADPDISTSMAALDTAF